MNHATPLPVNTPPATRAARINRITPARSSSRLASIGVTFPVVSKKSKRRAKRHRKPKPFTTICQRCGVTQGAAPPELLGAVASALNVCEEAGLEPELALRSVFTEYGYVLRMADGRWDVRNRNYDKIVAPKTPVIFDDDELQDVATRR